MTTFAPTAADITFHEEDHTYWAGLVQIPSVSEILRPITDDYLRTIPAHILERKRDIGKAVHTGCELIDSGYELDPDSVDDDVNGYIEGYKKFLLDRRPTWEAIEKKVFDPERWYAGRMDRAGLIGGRSYIIDLKTEAKSSSTKTPLDKRVAVQLTAYAEAYNRDYERAVVRLLPNGDYDFYPVEDKPDVWAALLTLHQFKAGRK